MNEHLEYDGITENDAENLKFLISLSPESMSDWLKYVDLDDLNYSILLMKMYHYRICDNSVEKSNLNEAKRVIKNIMNM